MGESNPEMADTHPCPNCAADVPVGARFCSSCGERQPDEAHGPTGATELRPVSALFADVVGSTSLGERLKPDEVKALIGECVSRMSHAVEEFGGSIQAYMGDGIAAYFGLPTAHEDDPERAARAALRILDVVGDYARDIADAWGIADFNVRVGINSGQVGVGMVGSAKPQEVGLGDATNVAARLQGAAAPGTIAVGEQTASLLAKRFTFEPMGAIEVKGREAAVEAWRLVGTRAETGEARTALVGREEEVARLVALVDDLVAGRGQIATIVGEVGIGKTRMLGELRAMAGDRVWWLEGRCLSYGGDLPYWPFVDMLRDWLRVAEGDAEVAVRTRLRARMGVCLGDRLPEVLPYLGRLLSVKLEPEMEDHLRMTQPELLARHIRAAFRVWIEALAAIRPVVVAVEDLHWGDPSTRELAESLLEITDRAPLVLVSTFRPDPASEAWKFRLRAMAEFQHRLAEIELAPLSRRASEEMAETLIPGGQLDEWTKGALVERAEGNPLYLEELLRGLIESGALERRRSWTLSVSTEDLLPPALESLLVARIDRLPPSARNLIQVAAVVGRTFPVKVLQRVAASDTLEEDIGVLLRADLLREHRRYPELEYTFKHGLLQEAALAALPASTQRELYASVAAAVEGVFEESIDEHLEVLAHYSTQARELPKALDYLERAGEKSMGRGATDQAAEMWRRARKVATRLDDEAAGDRIDKRLQQLEPTA